MERRDDLELIARFLTGGDREALGELFARHRSACYGLALHITRSAEDAEDVCQEAAERAVRNLEAFEPAGSFRSWLLKLASNAAKDLVRSRGARRAREARYAGDAAASTPQSEAAERSELSASVRAALREVEPHYRLPVVLIYELGLTNREAAAVMGVPENSVRTYASRGLEKLRTRLGRSGLALAPAAIAGLVKSTGGASLPPALISALDKIVAVTVPLPKGTAVGPSGGTAAGAAKGGVAMKVVLGTVLAGALAGGVALLNSVGAQHAAPLQSPPAAKGKPVIEHFAFTETEGYLDGPRKESMGPAKKGVAVDAKGNVYFAAVNSVASLRVARVDGMVETIAGDTGWGGSLPIDEGPAAFMGNLGYGMAIGRPSTAIAIKGLPLEGSDKGFLLVSSGKAVNRDNCIYKVWKNKEQGGRWWFKLFAGKGSAVLPSAAGQSAPVAGAKFRGFPGFGAAVDGNIYFHDRGYLYRLDDEKDTLTCLLAREDYDAKVAETTGKKEPNGRGPEPDSIIAAEDGGFYVGFYNGTYPKGWVFKVSADRKTVEPIATDAGGGLCDGPGLKTHYFGGPLLAKCCPKGNAFFGAIDDGIIRRWKDGRVSSLCRDGEWREFAKYGTWGCGEPHSLITHPYKDTQAPYWGRGWVVPPVAGNDYFYVTYMLGTGTGRLIRVGPVDFDKPTTAPLVGGN